MTSPYFNFCAAFRVVNAGALHEELSERLGTAPTSTCLRGQPVGALAKPATQDMWVLDSPLSEEVPLHLHLDWLEKKLEPHSDYIRQLVSKGIAVDIFCGYRTDSDLSHYIIPAEATAFANDIGVPLHMSYVVA